LAHSLELSAAALGPVTAEEAHILKKLDLERLPRHIAVIMDGNAVRSCVTPVSQARNHKLTTLEGLGTEQKPGALQVAFIEEQAAQCGYCMNGMVMGAKALLDKNPHPTVSDIKRSLNSYICRCGTHLRVIRAIQRVSNSSVKA